MLLKNFMQDELQVSKGSVKMPIKGLIEQYRDRYEEMSQDTSRPFQHMAYRTTPGDRLIVHVKVPSRSLPKFYYDVLLELDPLPGATSIEDCNVRIFSNSPSFVYTYAYVFFHLSTDEKPPASKRPGGMIIDQFTRKLPRDRLMIPGAEDKLGKEAASSPPVTRNPLGLPYFDTSIYTAIFYLEDVTTLAELQSSHNHRTVRQIFDSVSDFDHLMAMRQREVNKLQKEKARKQRAEQKAVQEAQKTASTRRAGSMLKPTRVSGGKTLTAPKSNRGKSGGVHRIG